MDIHRVGWIGLGSMGLAMATNIQNYLSRNNQSPFRYWNRTTSKGNALKDMGGISAQSITELAEACNVIWISVIDDAALKEVVEKLIQSGHIKDKIVIDTTTVAPSAASYIKNLDENGAAFVAAPCFGLPPAARAGQLLIAVGGPAPAIKSITPYLEGVLAKTVIQAGEEPSKAVLLKTTIQYLRGGFMYLICKAHTLAEKAGLPSDMLNEMLEKSFGPYAHAICQLLTSGAYIPAVDEAPKAALELAFKDIGHGMSLAKDVGMELKCADLLLDAATGAKSYGEEKGRTMDVSSIYGSIRRDAGLDFATAMVKVRDGAPKRGP